LEEFRAGLRDLGYAEGRDLAIEPRFAEGRLDRVAELAADLVRLEVAVIVAGGDAVIHAARDATRTIPIVMAVSGDPVGTGLVASLARPGGNVTGLTGISPEVSGKRLDLLKQAVPGASRVAVLWNAADPYKALDFRETEVAARALGARLYSLEVRGPGDFDGAFETASRERPDALIVFADPLTLTRRTRIVGFATQRGLPSMYELREFVDIGGLVAYGPSLNDLFRRSASYVDKILKGTKPAEMPVERPTRFDFVINLKTARALGLTIPPSVLTQATEVIE